MDPSESQGPGVDSAGSKEKGPSESDKGPEKKRAPRRAPSSPQDG